MHAVVLEALRIHAAVGYRAEAEIARLYRDAPMILIGEGTSEIQKTLIAQGVLDRWSGDPAAPGPVRPAEEEALLAEVGSGE